MDRTLNQFLLDVVRDFEKQTADNAGSDVIIDGSFGDGRPQTTKTNVAELKYVVEQLKACMDTDDRRAIVNKWRVNGEPIF